MSYSAPAFLNDQSDVNAPTLTGELDAIRLANGGYILIGDTDAGHMGGAIYDASGTLAYTVAPLTGTNGSVAEFDFGQLAVAGEAPGGGIGFTILDPTGQVSQAFQTVSSFGSDLDISALHGGGFALGYTMTVEGTAELLIDIRDFLGNHLTTIPIPGTDTHSSEISVAGLGNFDVAATWVQTDPDSGNKTVMYAVYGTDGSIVHAPSAIPTPDTQFGDHPDIVATASGFSIGYEARSAPHFTEPSSIDIWVDNFSATGGFNGQTQITNQSIFSLGSDDGSDDTHPHLAAAADGTLLVSYTLQDGETALTAVHNGTVLDVNTLSGTGGPSTNVVFGVDEFAVFHSNPTGSTGSVYFGSSDGSGDDADDMVTGDDFKDDMNGGGGSDHLNGGGNDDDVKGDDGADILHGGDGNDVVTGFGDVGDDGSADKLYGDAGIDQLFGGDGNDTMDGGAGADQMTGGGGNDLYYVDNTGDKTFEAVGDGTDTVFTTLSYVLQAGQSIDYLATTSRLGTAAINLTGNALAQRIDGNYGDNILSGGGGGDTLYGFAGNDKFIVSNAGDKVFEATGQGNDTVFASVSYTLQAGQSVELLATSSRAGTGALHLTGNTLSQRIDGNFGNNVITGGGSDSHGDTLYGFAGSDTFYISNAADKVFEATSDVGSDTVFASVSYTLQAGQSIEYLATTSRAATGTITLTGNNLNQRIDGNYGINGLYGGDGNDTLYGFDGNDRLGGGNGRDLMDGGAGNDIFTYSAVFQSTGVTRDLIQNMNFAQDKFDLPSLPTGIDTKVVVGTLNEGSFDTNLVSAIGAGQLAAHHAVLFDPSDGNDNIAGHMFLIIDVNGTAGYQAGADYVIELQSATGTLTLGDFT